jgi:DNA repair exonuclease SbcCD ATPase subunit
MAEARMRIERVALRGFLSHSDTDWQPDGARLVSIVGANGAGKSSLAVDALLFALYDDARGRTDDLVSLGATDMSARVEFAFAGNTYAVERGRTRKAGGKSYLEFLVRDGDAWRPLTGDTIRDTQDKIAGLLRMDDRAFETSVVLGQGHAMAFAEATAAERKRILGQVLDLEVYARAETRARELARDLEATITASGGQFERVETAIAELGDPATDRDQAVEAVADATTTIAAAQERRTAIDARQLGLAADLAAGAAAEASVARLDGERASLADRYRREQKAIADAAAAADAARTRLASADEVEQAIADLPAAQAALVDLEALEAEDRRIASELATAAAELDVIERPYERDHAGWSVQWKDAKKKVGEQETHGRAGTSICEACGQPIGKDTALEQLGAARATVKDLEAAEPKRPLAIDRHRATIARLEAKRPKVDHAITAAARERVTRLTAAAARGEAIITARAALVTARTTAADATAELAKITAAGEALAQQLAAAKAKATGLQSLRDEQAALHAEIRDLGARCEAAEAMRRVAERAVANAEASLARFEQLQAEREALSESINAAGDELGILRQLVVAFGVTGIPARIIESVIPELEGYANELLAELRPGLTLAIRAQRAKKDGKGLVEALDLVVRDPAGERPLAMFSGGERMSVSLAIAVALSRLVARRAGAAIRTLVVDEPDGLDADARRAFGQALRVLAHRGELERVVLVSHHEDLAEFGDATYRVTKNGHGSVLEQV